MAGASQERHGLTNATDMCGRAIPAAAQHPNATSTDYCLHTLGHPGNTPGRCAVAAHHMGVDLCASVRVRACHIM